MDICQEMFRAFRQIEDGSEIYDFRGSTYCGWILSRQKLEEAQPDQIVVIDFHFPLRPLR